MAIPLQQQLQQSNIVENNTLASRETKKTEGGERQKLDLPNPFSRVTIKEKIFFVQQIGIMIRTGISLAVALRTLSEQTSNKKLKSIISDLEETVERGNLLSDGLEKHKKTFGELFVNMVRAGEQSGKLEDIMQQLFIQMKKDHGTLSKVRSAMIYPVIVISAMAGVGTMVVVYVIPNLTAVFNEMGSKLPFTTEVLIAISKFVTRYGLYIIIGLIAAVIAFHRAISSSRGKFIFHKFLLSIPIAGGIIKKINLARFCRTFSSLLKTDIAIIKSFEITANVLRNELYRQALLSAKEYVKKGKNIHDSLEQYNNLFPPVIIQMISVGEETGTLDSILEQSASFYEEEIDQTMKNLPSIIEPVLMIVLGIGVAIMAIAIIMPMYTLGQS